MDTTETSALQAEIDAVLAEHGGDARAAIAALLHDIGALARDAENCISHGYVRGHFAQPKPRRRFSGTSGE